MSYKLEKPYTEKQRLDFIVEYNHNKNLKIEETSQALYALEAWELLQGDEVIDNTEAYEAEKAQQERERIGKLKLTKREVFLGLYQAKGVTPEQIKAQITDLGVNEGAGSGNAMLESEVKKALIEFEYANDYFRGNPLIDIVGATLGILPEQLDKFFETNDYHNLLVESEVLSD